MRSYEDRREIERKQRASAAFDAAKNGSPSARTTT
jgi:hypothetical protein